MIVGQYRGKRLFAGRLFAGRLFGPVETVEAPLPAPSFGGGGGGGFRLTMPRTPRSGPRITDDDDLLVIVAHIHKVLQ